MAQYVRFSQLNFIFLSARVSFFAFALFSSIVVAHSKIVCTKNEIYARASANVQCNTRDGLKLANRER